MVPNSLREVSGGMLGQAKKKPLESIIYLKKEYFG
jgi:hypothetical protein